MPRMHKYTDDQGQHHCRTHGPQNLYSETVVDCVGKPQIFIQCSCLIAPVPGYITSQHCEEPGCSFQTLEGRSLIGYWIASFNVLTYRFT